MENNNENNGFQYTYSAKEQTELKRKSHIIDKTTKIKMSFAQRNSTENTFSLFTFTYYLQKNSSLGEKSEE